ncbi:MAG: sugar phosphate isomerase/epimerase [Ruminococcaceae bacterium]|nr:sugar phosphate isomerase/epimerase [Oscillospiraceae bacterium]
MKIGASTSCFYPVLTEKALDKVIELGFETGEVFFNSSCELEDRFTTEMKKHADSAGMKILSVHPFSSFIENTCIFGEYQRRYDDFIDLYKKQFHAAAVLGADIAVIHGALAVQKRDIPEELYFDRFASLIELGKAEGVRVCQENVVRFRSQSLDFLKRMRSVFGDDFNMVFDIKQAIRSGYDPFEIVEEMKDDIVHLHLSDNTPDCDCMPPGRGSFDFKRLFDTMAQANYSGGAVIEIYSKGYDVETELAKSKEYFDKLI